MIQKATVKSNIGKPGFDYTKKWYLLPYDPEDTFYGSLHAGRVLHDKSAFRKRKDNRLTSRIRIADQINICRELSEHYVYPVKLNLDTRVETLDEYSWYAAEVELLEPLNFWDTFSNCYNVFTGTINLSGQPYLPQGLRFPSVLKGDLIFNNIVLPSTIKLPDVIEGELVIQFCNIPPAWKLPRKVNKIILTGSSFYQNINFLASDVTSVSIESCRHGPDVLFPREFPGHIQLEYETLLPGFKLPDTVGNLSLSNVQFEKGATLPGKILGELVMHDIKDFRNINLPDSCTAFTAAECKLPLNILSSVTDLKEIEFIHCELPNKFVIPELFLTKLSFVEMDVPKGLKLASDFTGTLKFENATIPEGFKFPNKLKGKLEILYSVIKGTIKLPVNKDYDIFMIEGDDITNLIAPEWLKNKIVFLKSNRLDDELPF